MHTSDLLPVAIGSDLSLLLPEGVLLLTFIILALVGMISPKAQATPRVLAGLGIVISTIMEISSRLTTPLNTPLMGDQLQIDGIASLGCVTVNILALMLIVMHAISPKKLIHTKPEYLLLLLTSVLGMHFMLLAQQWIVLYVAMEMVSISSYVWVAWRKTDRQASQAALKYVLFGAFSSAIMIYAISWWYGLTGSLVFAPTWPLDVQVSPLPIAIIQCTMLAGLLFKVSAVPFHFWTPDTYAGAPYPVAGFLATASKLSALAVLAKLMIAWEAYPSFSEVQRFVGIIAILSLVFGTTAAIWQPEIKRLLAWSGITQSGFMLAILAVQTTDHLAAFWFYAITYAWATMIAFGLADRLTGPGKEDLLSLLAGKVKTERALGIGLVILLVSLAGLPPTIGFMAKWYLFLALVEAADPFSVSLLVTCALATVIGFVYYLKPAREMVFRKSMQPPVDQTSSVPAGLIVGMCVIPVLIFGVWGFDRWIAWLGFLWN
ncbi:NADH-quinone oxidoreductase subunit N [Pontibacter sp. G13]|uniref:NADH-quinone oxidoreductase subunit N n=1 Tax=Pontibacter sp. G13 TaxID=3074898 RepID=UPI00288BAAA5|nr:NADH-quinone oxidoreductase subunit N [Pontibacter sp. G13]WNJ16256.1 NADH-quinone oxidoreductase subunit N [Pontibacter sp. G13]